MADDTLQRMLRWNLLSYRRLSVYIFDEVTQASTAHEQVTLVIIVSYKHNVVAKPMTPNELRILELQTKSTLILASIPDALWDICKLSIGYNSRHRNPLWFLLILKTLWVTNFKIYLYINFIKLYQGSLIMIILRGYYNPNQKLACFVCYLKIINTFLKNNICIL